MKKINYSIIINNNSSVGYYIDLSCYAGFFPEALADESVAKFLKIDEDKYIKVLEKHRIVTREIKDESYFSDKNCCDIIIRTFIIPNIFFIKLEERMI